MNPPLPSGALLVAIGPGGRSGEFIQLRAQPDSAAALNEALRRDGIETGILVQESLEIPDLTALVVSISTGLGGVAAAISTFLRRHRDKAILMDQDGSRYELRGMSPEEMDALLRRMLETAAENQRNAQHLYRSIPGADDEAHE